jgi:regulator of replication initiation timing
MIMNDLQKMFNENMKKSLKLEIEQLQAEVDNPKSKPAKNKQRILAIEAKKESIKQIEELTK